MQGFQKVVGHQEIITHLQNAISMNKVSHAYLFGGESGSGKKMMASLFAMTLQCEKHGVEPCMECPSCKKAQSQNHPDIIYVKHEKPNTISIDEIREQLINDVMIKPYSSPYKIYIIDEAQKLTLQAQNALLKTIEEPPAYAVVMLLADNPDALLPTISSRCVQLNLKPVGDQLVKDCLMNEMCRITRQRLMRPWRREISEKQSGLPVLRNTRRRWKVHSAWQSTPTVCRCMKSWRRSKN